MRSDLTSHGLWDLRTNRYHLVGDHHYNIYDPPKLTNILSVPKYNIQEYTWVLLGYVCIWTRVAVSISYDDNHYTMDLF